MNQEDTMAAVEELKANGFPFPKTHPGHEDFDLPRDLESLSNIELGNHLGAWASLYSRARFDLAKATADTHSIESKIRWFKAHSMARAGAEKGAKVNFVKAKIEAMPEMQEYKGTLDVCEIKVTLLEALAEGYKKKYDAISREIGRRSIDKDNYSRSTGA